MVEAADPLLPNRVKAVIERAGRYLLAIHNNYIPENKGKWTFLGGVIELVDPRDVAVGFLYHRPSGKVLLHLRAADASTSPGKWAFFGGGLEPEDAGDLAATWRRELREELGAAVDAANILHLDNGVSDAGARWHVLYCEWPSLDTTFVLTNGQRYAWFTIEEAFSLPELADYARSDLLLFRQRIGLPPRIEPQTGRSQRRPVARSDRGRELR